MGQGTGATASLLTLVRGDDRIPALDDDDWADLLRLATAQRLLSWLAVQLAGREGVPDYIAARLRAVRQEQAVHQLRMLADLSQIGPVLDAAGVPWLVVKGPALGASAYGIPEEREYGDLDLLVSPAGFGTCLDLLAEQGGQLQDRNWPMIRRTARGELTVTLARGTSLDLHWHLLNTPVLRCSFSLDTDDLLSRRGEVAVDDQRIPALDPVDEMVYVALHAVLAGAHQLVWLLDVAQLVRRTSDWNAVVDRAVETGTAMTLAVALARAETIVHAPVPAGLLTRLTGMSPWRVGLSAVQRRLSTPTWLEGGHSLRTVVSSTRQGTLSSGVALLSLLRSEVVPSWRGRPSGLGDYEELQRDVPGRDDRARFLKEVSATADSKALGVA